MNHKPSTINQNKGFSLIELSIVLLIIAAIIGAVYGGEELLDSAKRNAVITDLQQFKLYTDQFKEKYEGIPGDLSDATSYFGNSNTNNGDGNGIINYTTGVDNDLFSEAYLAWKHLELAGFLDGPFTGNNTNFTTTYGPGFPPIIGADVPEAPYENSAYLYTRLSAEDFYSPSSNLDLNANGIMIGNQLGETGNETQSLLDTFVQPALKPIDIFNIDVKMDDGLPMGGLILGVGSSSSPQVKNCANISSLASDLSGRYIASSAPYDRASNDLSCVLFYQLGLNIGDTNVF